MPCRLSKGIVTLTTAKKEVREAEYAAKITRLAVKMVRNTIRVENRVGS
jgi:hypothetical protein